MTANPDIPPTSIRLVPADAARYARLRLWMLNGAPWAFSASPDNDVSLDVGHLSNVLAEEHSQFLLLRTTRLVAFLWALDETPNSRN